MFKGTCVYLFSIFKQYESFLFVRKSRDSEKPVMSELTQPLSFWDLVKTHACLAHALLSFSSVFYITLCSIVAYFTCWTLVVLKLKYKLIYKSLLRLLGYIYVVVNVKAFKPR